MVAAEVCAAVRDFVFNQEKSRREAARGTASLDTTPARCATIACADDGNPWKERVLSQAVDRLQMRLAKRGKIRRDYRATAYATLKKAK